MPREIFAVIIFLFLLVIFLAWRLLRSNTWKQLQLRKAAKMATGGDTDGMLRYLERNMRRNDVSDPLTNALIYFHIRSGAYDLAERAIRDAIDGGDGSGMALAQLGYVAGGRGDRAAAEEYYREALEKDDSLKGTMYINIAGMLIESNERLQEAEDLLRQALELREGAAKSGVHMNLAMLHLRRKQPVEARVQAMTAYELIPAGSLLLNTSRANALAVAARACTMQGESDEAARLAGKALKLVDEIPGMEKLADELKHMVSGDTPGK